MVSQLVNLLLLYSYKTKFLDVLDLKYIDDRILVDFYSTQQGDLAIC